MDNAKRNVCNLVRENLRRLAKRYGAECVDQEWRALALVNELRGKRERGRPKGAKNKHSIASTLKAEVIESIRCHGQEVPIEDAIERQVAKHYDPGDAKSQAKKRLSAYFNKWKRTAEIKTEATVIGAGACIVSATGTASGKATVQGT
jgi:hypothetical protein